MRGFHIGRTLLRLSLVLAACIILGFGLLLAAYSLPVSPIATHVRLSVPMLDGAWETGEIAYEQLIKGYISTQLDNSTDANMLLAAAHESDQSLIHRALTVSTYLLDGRSYPALLAYGQNGTESLDNTPMARYWLGFLVLLKPLLSMLNYMDIRMLMMILQLMLLCAVVAGMVYRGLIAYTPAFTLALLAVTPGITGFSMQFSTVYTLFLFAMLALLIRPQLLTTPYCAAVFFLLTGAATCYFDYLTYPIATFGMPFVLALLLQPGLSRKQAIRFWLICLGAWLFGFFGMWAGKWLLVILLGNDPWFLPNLLAKISERSAYAAQNDVSISFLMVLEAVLGVFAKKAYIIAGIAVLFGYLVVFVRHHSYAKSASKPAPSLLSRNAAMILPLLLTAVLPFIWYALTSNHTYNHAFFTSRALVVFAFAGMAMLTLPLRKLPTTDATSQEQLPHHPLIPSNDG